MGVRTGISYSADMEREPKGEAGSVSDKKDSSDRRQKKWDKAAKRRSEEESLNQQIRDAAYAGNEETATQLREQLRQLRQSDLRE